MASNVTANRGYQLPDAANKLKDDVLRVIAALSAIDTDVAGLLLALANKSDAGHGHGMAAITGLVAALGNKLDVGYHDALANLTDVDVAGVANGMALLRQASKWIPVALQINNIAGLETALNGKATPADITAAVNALVAAAPGTLDTLNELATALGDDPNFAATVTSALGAKLAKVQNLADLPDKAAARTNLDVPSLSAAILRDQDQNAKAASAAFKVNIGKNALRLWEKIGDVIDMADQSEFTWTGLNDFERLRVTFDGVPKSASNGPYIRFGGDSPGGSAGEGYYNSYIDALQYQDSTNPTTVYGAFQPADTARGFLDVNWSASFGGDFMMEIGAFNKPRLTYFKAVTGEHNPGGSLHGSRRGYCVAPDVFNRLRFSSFNGGQYANGSLTLEGIRG